MFHKLKEQVDDLGQKARVWARERKERAEARRALRIHESQHDSRFWLLSVPAAATILAAIVEWYWAILFCIQATGNVDWNWSTAAGSSERPIGEWNFSFSAHLPVLIGLICATAPIIMWSMVWLPVQFKARGSGRVRRATMIVTGILANVLVIVSGTVVMNYNRQTHVREQLVVEQTADAQRTMLSANVEDLRGELATLMNHRSGYVATAASVGATAYERDYVAQARATRDPRLPLLERALGSARRADELRHQISAARVSVAAAAPAAATVANVDDRVGVGLNTFAQYAEVYRPPFVALLCTLVGIFGVWWWIALAERMNPITTSGWAPEDRRIEDHSDEAPLDVDPAGMRPAREVVTDAETGEELIRIKPREHWRKRKGKKQEVEFTPEVPPDEVGVDVDGGNRIGSTIDAGSEPDGDDGRANEQDLPEIKANEDHSVRDDAGRVPLSVLSADTAQSDVAVEDVRRDERADEPQHLELPEQDLSEDELLALQDLEQSPGTTDEPVEPAVVIDADPEPVRDEADVSETEQPADHDDLYDHPRQPETNPARLLESAE